MLYHKPKVHKLFRKNAIENNVKKGGDAGFVSTHYLEEMQGSFSQTI